MSREKDQEALLRAIHDSVNPTRLLPGEEPSTPYADDIVHWLSVYGELVSTKRDLLQELRRHLDAGLTDAAQKELEHSDLGVIQAQLDRLQRRLEFWEARADAGQNPEA